MVLLWYARNPLDTAWIESNASVIKNRTLNLEAEEVGFYLDFLARPKVTSIVTRGRRVTLCPVIVKNHLKASIGLISDGSLLDARRYLMGPARQLNHHRFVLSWQIWHSADILSHMFYINPNEVLKRVVQYHMAGVRLWMPDSSTN